MEMKLGRYVLYILVLAVFFVSSCQDEKEKGDYSGVSSLIAERNKARYKKKEDSRKEKGGLPRVQRDNVNPTAKMKDEKLSPTVLYEEDVEIVGAESNRTLAKGVAYLNKNGQIVKIKILKDRKDKKK